MSYCPLLIRHILAVYLLHITVLATAEPLSVEQETDRTLTLSFNLPAFTLQTDAEQGCQKIVIEGEHWPIMTAPGYPHLPISGSLLQVPAEGRMMLEVLDATQSVLPVASLCLSDDDADNLVSSPVTLGERAIMRDVPIARLTLRPFQWSADTQTLTYYSQARLQIHFEQPLPIDTSTARQRRSGTVAGVYESMLGNTLLNYQGPVLTVSRMRRAAVSAIAEVQGTEVTSGKQSSFAAEADAIRIAVNRTGIHWLLYEDMEKAGLSPGSLPPDSLQLFHRDTPVAIRVVTANAGHFQAGDYIEFYGEALDSEFSDTNVYWLHWRKKGVPLRISTTNGSISGQAPVLNNFTSVLRFEENHEIWESTPGAPEQDYWFWQRLQASQDQPLVQDYTLNLPDVMTGAGITTVKAIFQGRSTATPKPNHHTRLVLNGTAFSSERWDGETVFVQTGTVSTDLLKNGENTLTVTLPGDSGAVVDTIYLNALEVTYPRAFRVVNDELGFQLGAGKRVAVTITGLTTGDVILYDITNTQSPIRITNTTVTATGNQFSLSFEANPGSLRQYYLTSTKNIRFPAAMQNWRNAHMAGLKKGADYILITADEFMEAVQPLAQLRQQQGLRVQVVSVEELFNEFNKGIPDPRAIRDFLAFAYENWEKPSPTYVLLAGDANIDYRGYISKKDSKVPVYLSPSSNFGLTPDDNWYVSVQGEDVLPEMLIGRIPGHNSDSITDVVNKIVQYESNPKPYNRRAMLVSDRGTSISEGNHFELINNNLIAQYLAGFDAHKVYVRDFGENVDKATTERIRQTIIDNFNTGVMVTNYIGHGTIDRWSGRSGGILRNQDIPLLTNSNELPLVFTMTCINGYFAHTTGNALAEALVARKDGGAIGSIAPSGVSYVSEDELMAQEAFESIFKRKNRRLGAIAVQAKLLAYNLGASEQVVKMFTLFGDPATYLNNW